MTYVEEKSHVDFTQKERELKELIDVLQEKNIMFQILKKSLEKFEGKKLNKRVTYDLKGAGYTVHYEKEKWGTVCLSVWGGELEYGNRLWFTFPEEQVEEFCMKYFLEREEYLNSKILKHMAGYEKVLEELPAILAELNMRIDFFNESLREYKKAEQALHPPY